MNCNLSWNQVQNASLLVVNAAHRMFHFLDEKAILLTMTAFDTDNKHHKSNRDNTCYVISTYCKREGYMID